MSEIPIEVEGTVRADGTLELDNKLSLPAGRVKVTVRPVQTGRSFHEHLLATIDKIRASQEARGYVPRSAEEIDAEMNAMRDEAEEEFLAVEQLQEEAAKARQEKLSSTEPGA